MSCLGDLFHITFQYFLEIITYIYIDIPIVGWCSIRTLIKPCLTGSIACQVLRPTMANPRPEGPEGLLTAWDLASQGASLRASLAVKIPDGFGPKSWNPKCPKISKIAGECMDGYSPKYIKMDGKDIGFDPSTDCNHTNGTPCKLPIYFLKKNLRPTTYVSCIYTFGGNVPTCHGQNITYKTLQCWRIKVRPTHQAAPWPVGKKTAVHVCSSWIPQMMLQGGAPVRWLTWFITPVSRVYGGYIYS